MAEGNIVWVRSLLAVYRQAAVDAAQEGIDPAMRQRVLAELASVHALITPHEEIGALWREAFGGSEDGVRSALAPLVEGALLCDPASPIRALAEFAAEEIAFVFEEE